MSGRKANQVFWQQRIVGIDGGLDRYNPTHKKGDKGNDSQRTNNEVVNFPYNQLSQDTSFGEFPKGSLEHNKISSNVFKQFYHRLKIRISTDLGWD